jgi:hypothetical protein
MCRDAGAAPLAYSFVTVRSENCTEDALPLRVPGSEFCL